MRKLKTLHTFGLALLAVGMLTLLAALGVLDALDNAACDALYQSRNATDGEIVLIGIDDRAIEELGPYGQWNRDIIAMTLEALNQSEDCRPAAIGIDVLYTGESVQDLDDWRRPLGSTETWSLPARLSLALPSRRTERAAIIGMIFLC